MTFLYLLLLVTPCLALRLALPKSFGGKTEFSDRGWRVLTEQLSPEVKFGPPPTRQVSMTQEPTCVKQFTKCSTSYFGKILDLKQPDVAHLWVKWHQDATPFACDSPDGCTVTSASSIADLTSQSKGWGIKASLNVEVRTENDIPAVNGGPKASLSFQHSEGLLLAKPLVSKRTLSCKCTRNHMCYISTGALMMTVNGKCDSRPLIVCDRRYFPCEEFNRKNANMCSQWDTFTWKHCRPGISKNTELCSLSVAVTRDDGVPISFQVFEQKPIPGKGSIIRRESAAAEGPFGELSDGSSGVWMSWSP